MDYALTEMYSLLGFRGTLPSRIPDDRAERVADQREEEGWAVSGSWSWFEVSVPQLSVTFSELKLGQCLRYYDIQTH